MDSIKAMFQDVGDWITIPFKKNMPISRLVLITILFIIAAFIVFDGLRILKSWMEAATDVAADAVT